MAGIEVASLFGVIDLVDNLTPGLRNADRSLGNFGQRLSSIGDSITGFGTRMTALTAPITAFGIAGVHTASSFQNAMAEISARTGIVGDDLSRISDLALQLGADTAFSAQQAADAFLQLLASGQTAEEAIATLPAVLDAAAASGEDLGMTADMVTDIMAAFGLDVDAAASVVDSLARAAGASSADIASLGQGFGNVGSVARSFGLSVEETAAILAIFSENGIKGAEAGTQLRSMLLAMSADTEAAHDAWNTLGTSMYDAQGNMRPMSDILRDIAVATADMTDQEQQQLFRDLGGAYGIMGLQALTAGMSIEDMQQRMSESASATDVAAARMDTFSGRLDTLRGSVETLMIKAFTPLMDDFLQPMVEQAAEIVNGITDWVAANPQLASTIGTVTTVAVGLVAALIPAGMALGAIGTALGALLSPVGLAIGAVVALGVAYAANFGGIRDFVVNEIQPRLEAFFSFLGGVWEDTIQPGLSQLVQWFTDTGLPAAMAVIDSVVQPAIDNFSRLLGGLWDAVSPALTTLLGWFQETGLPIIQQFIDDTINNFITPFVNLVGAIWERVQPALQSVFDWFTGTGLPLIGTALDGALNNFVLPLIETLADFWHTISDGVGAVLNWFTSSGLPLIDTALSDAKTRFLDPLISTLQGIWEAIRPGVEALRDGIGGVFNFITTNIIQPVINAINGILGAVQSAISAIMGLQTQRDALAGGQFYMGGGSGTSIYASPYVTNQGGGGVSYGGYPVAGHDYPGMGYADVPYAIGKGAQPELFIPSTDGYFIPNIDRVLENAGGKGDTTVINVTVAERQVLSEQAARENGRAFGEEVMQMYRARG